MFIAIDAKADIEGSKKGKFTPAQHAQLTAWSLAKKTGILDCLDKCEATFQSYNVANNVAIVEFKRGYIVICGRLVECEANTKVAVSAPVSGTIKGKIVLRYSLGNSKEEEFKVYTTTGDIVQQDLNENPINGVYEFELYSYEATTTTVTLTRTNTNYIKSVEVSLKNIDEELEDIDSRLDELVFELGFENDVVELSSGYADVNRISKQGKLVLVHLEVYDVVQSATKGTYIVGYIPKKHLPNYNGNNILSFPVLAMATSHNAATGQNYRHLRSATATIDCTSGEIKVTDIFVSNDMDIGKLEINYEYCKAYINIVYEGNL